MNKTLLILGIIALVFAGCKKFDEIEASKVEMNDVTIERGWDYIKMSGGYDYPVELETMTLYISEKEDMSGAKTYGCVIDGKTFSVEADDLKDGTKYHFQYEYDNGYVKEKGEKGNAVTIDKPIVVTKDAGGITLISAVLTGELTNNDAANEIEERGFCWATELQPTIAGTHHNCGGDTGVGTSTFSHNISNLQNNVRYYFRAYTKTNYGIIYGEEKSFTTAEITLPAVATSNITNIKVSSATCGGNVTSDGNVTVTARGVCWSTNPNPTINDNNTNNGSGTGNFTSNLTNLTENTTYYVRAYATNEKGTAYGEEKSFKTVEVTLPTVTTKDVTNITTNSATCGGNVTDDGNGTVTARGICWSEVQNPTINNIYSEETNNGTGTGSFTSQLTNLKDNTTYYVRAYATNEKGTSYGEERIFKTESLINGYDWVDLGLPSGLKWATCNVGADSPEDYGNYYAWGETETKSEYTKENSLTYGLSILELQSQGIIDGNNNLTPLYDAAAANWGSTWRMPTKEDLKELVDNCNWEMILENDVYGVKVIGINGCSVFFPTTGCYKEGMLYYAGQDGYYWNSTSVENDSRYTFGLYISGDNNGALFYYDRYVGFTVRPVSE